MFSKLSSNTRTIFFMMILSFVCALILSVLASALAEPKEIAKDLDRSKQMMIAAKVLSHEGGFLLKNEKGESISAKYQAGILVPESAETFATNAEILEIYNKTFLPLLVNDKGEKKTFAELGINLNEYLSDFKKTGYYKQPWKLIYEILPNQSQEDKNIAQGYVIPINGYGLWDAIYGYLALQPDGNTVIGVSWYDQKETPGLGANIVEAYWQNLFPGKKIFQENLDGTTDFKTAPIGITVVKGKVAEVYGDSSKAKSAVDGMTGATLTGNGVTDAYKDVLAAYRPFLIKAHQDTVKENG